MKSRLYTLIGPLSSVLFVYLAVRKVDFAESVRVLGTVQLGWLLVATLVFLCAYPVRALRWRLILRDQKALSLGEVIVPVFVGQMANNILPMRTGEIYRAHFLGRRARISRSGVMGSIVVERTFEGLMLVVTILPLFFLFPQTQFLRSWVLIMGVTFLILAAGILFYGIATEETHHVTNKMFSLLPPKLGKFVSGWLEAFLLGIRGISTTGGYLKAGVYTMLIWMLEAGAIALVLESFQVSVPLSGLIFVYTLAGLSTILPSGPGYIGPLQYAFVLSLGIFGISEEAALAVSLAAQLALMGSVTAIGLVLLWKGQLCTQKPSK